RCPDCEGICPLDIFAGGRSLLPPGHSHAPVLEHDAEEGESLFIHIDEALEPRMQECIVPYQGNMRAPGSNPDGTAKTITGACDAIGRIQRQDRTSCISDRLYP